MPIFLLCVVMCIPCTRLCGVGGVGEKGESTPQNLGVKILCVIVLIDAT